MCIRDRGKMIADYIKAHADTIDRNGDGVIGYVLAIGDICLLYTSRCV